MMSLTTDQSLQLMAFKVHGSKTTRATKTGRFPQPVRPQEIFASLVSGAIRTMSKVKEDENARTSFLKTMAIRLRNRCFVSKIFISPSCASSSVLLKRDMSNSELDLDYGNAQGNKKKVIVKLLFIEFFLDLSSLQLAEFVNLVLLVDDPQNDTVYERMELSTTEIHETITQHTTLYKGQVSRFTQFSSQNKLNYLKARVSRKRQEDATRPALKDLYVMREPHRGIVYCNSRGL